MQKMQVIPRAVRVQRAYLDSLGQAYARLLLDPCNAPLVHSVYGGAEGTYLIKAESIATIANGTGNTSGVYQWTPGVLSNTGTILGVNDGTTTAFGAADFIPGFTFLTNNACQVRAVAACLEITYPGSEASRAGRVHYGQCGGGTLQPTMTGQTVASFAPVLEHMERTPAGKIEVLWRPGQADGLFREESTGASIVDRERRAAIGVAFAGLPLDAAGNGVGLTIKQTCVYEYKPALGIGLTMPTVSRFSTSTLQDVMQFLLTTGAQFARSTASRMAQNLAYAATSGAMGYTSRSNPRLTLRNEL